jgi:hypothetical protein
LKKIFFISDLFLFCLLIQKNCSFFILKKNYHFCVFFSISVKIRLRYLFHFLMFSFFCFCCFCFFVGVVVTFIISIVINFNYLSIYFCYLFFNFQFLNNDVVPFFCKKKYKWQYHLFCNLETIFKPWRLMTSQIWTVWDSMSLHSWIHKCSLMEISAHLWNKGGIHFF